MGRPFPVMPPPPGGDQNRAGETYGVVISIVTLSTISVAARMYARIHVIHNVGWDDYTILLSQFINLVDFCFQILMTRRGIGRHMYYLDFEALVDCGLYYHIVEMLYVLSTATIKVSACLFLLRIMARGTSKTLRWFLYCLMSILSVICVATAIVILVQCIPIQAGWDPRVEGKCWSFPQVLGIGYAQNAWAIISDFVCAAFPIIILRKLKMNRRNKCGLWFIMSIGLLSAVCCIIKMARLSDLTKGDFTWNGVFVNLWGVLEPNIGVIACSIPALQPLFKALNERSTQGGSNTKGNRNTPVLSSWKDSTTNKFSSRSRTFHSIKNDTSSDSEEQILPVDDGGKGIRKTTDVQLFYHEADKDKGKDQPIEMV